MEPPFGLQRLERGAVKDSWEVLGRVVGTPLSAAAFEVLREHVTSLPGCHTRRVKLSAALKKKHGRENTAEAGAKGDYSHT